MTAKGTEREYRKRKSKLTRNQVGRRGAGWDRKLRRGDLEKKTQKKGDCDSRYEGEKQWGREGIVVKKMPEQ